MIKLSSCELCPRRCRVDRNFEVGYCKASYDLKVAKAFLHKWEEPCISGENGSGAIFFSNCNLGCLFCQNYELSHESFGKVIRMEELAEIMINLQNKGAENINLVSPTIYIPLLAEAILLAKEMGLRLPVVYNCSGYETLEGLRHLDGLIDVYLPDLKYCSDQYSVKYSNAPNYFIHAATAVKEMIRQVGIPVFEHGMIVKGVMIRHLMLPGLLFDSKKIVDFVLSDLPEGIYLNLMCQYIPMGRAKEFKELNRRIHPGHYEALLQYALEQGLQYGFFQDYDSASGEYVPVFDLEGVK